MNLQGRITVIFAYSQREADSRFLYAELIPGGVINDKYWKPEK